MRNDPSCLPRARFATLPVAVLLFSLCLLWWNTVPARAQNIQVNATCLITDAVRAANTETTQGNCVPDGSGAPYTVVLEPDTTYTIFTAEDTSAGNSAFSAITNTVIIRGNNAIIERNPLYGCPAGDADNNFRHFRITPNGALTLLQVTLAHGCVAGEPGGALHNSGRLALIGSTLRDNGAEYGGGIYQSGIAAGAVISDTQVLSNTGQIAAGGIVLVNSTMTITHQSRIAYNRALDGPGGGLIGELNSRLHVSNAEFIGNQSGSSSGGAVFFDAAVQAQFDDVTFLENQATNGGGLLATTNDLAFNNTRFYSNTAEATGGGAYIIVSSPLTVTGGSRFAHNQAGQGAGLYLTGNGSATLSQTHFVSNTATSQGGGVAIDDAVNASLQGVLLIHNLAEVGGALRISKTAQVAVTGARLLYNSNALAQTDDAQTTLANSCIVGNGDVAVANSGSINLAALNNWWGESDGPSGAGMGSGNSVSAGVSFDPFLTTIPLDDCPELGADIQVGVTAGPAALPPSPLLPGQPLTYTIMISNAGPAIASGVGITLPIGPLLANVESTSDSDVVPSGPLTWEIETLSPGTTRRITLTGQISTLVNVDSTLTATATATSLSADPDLSNNMATLERTIQPPRVHFSQAAYGQDEDAGPIDILLLLTPVNPYAAATVAFSAVGGSALEGIDFASASGTRTFAPGSEQQSFTVNVFGNDIADADKTVELSLSEPESAALGTPAAATLTILDNNVAGVVRSTGSLTVTEGGPPVTFTLRLSSRPLQPVQLEMTPGSIHCTVTPSLLIEPDAWDVDVVVTVSAVDNALADGTRSCPIQFSVASADAVYSELPAPALPVTVLDDDLAGLTAALHVEPAMAAVGDTVQYTLSVTNTGTVSVSGLAGTAARGGPLSLDDDTLPAAGASVTATWTITVTSEDFPGSLENSVTITGMAAGDVPVETTASVVVELELRIYVPVTRNNTRR